MDEVLALVDIEYRPNVIPLDVRLVDDEREEGGDDERQQGGSTGQDMPADITDEENVETTSRRKVAVIEPEAQQSLPGLTPRRKFSVVHGSTKMKSSLNSVQQDQEMLLQDTEIGFIAMDIEQAPEAELPFLKSIVVKEEQEVLPETVKPEAVVTEKQPTVEVIALVVPEIIEPVALIADEIIQPELTQTVITAPVEKTVEKIDVAVVAEKPVIVKETAEIQNIAPVNETIILPVAVETPVMAVPENTITIPVQEFEKIIPIVTENFMVTEIVAEVAPVVTMEPSAKMAAPTPEKIVIETIQPVKEQNVTWQAENVPVQDVIESEVTAIPEATIVMDEVVENEITIAPVENNVVVVETPEVLWPKNAKVIIKPAVEETIAPVMEAVAEVVVEMAPEQALEKPAVVVKEVKAEIIKKETVQPERQIKQQLEVVVEEREALQKAASVILQEMPEEVAVKAPQKSQAQKPEMRAIIKDNFPSVRDELGFNLVNLKVVHPGVSETIQTGFYENSGLFGQEADIHSPESENKPYWEMLSIPGIRLN